MTDRDWTIRTACGNDLPYIYSTWIQSFRYGSATGKSFKDSDFQGQYCKVIDRLLSVSKVRVAALPNDPYIIIGYCVSEPEVLHYIVTKKTFMKRGIARSLWEDAGSPLIFTHQTFMSDPITETHSDFIYNPYLLYKGEIYASTSHKKAHGKDPALLRPSGDDGLQEYGEF